MPEISMKRCSKGDNCVHPMGCWQPATLEHFRECKTVTSGLRSICRECDRHYLRQRTRKLNPKLAHKEEMERQGYKHCARDKMCLHELGCFQPATQEFFYRTASNPDGLSTYCKVCILHMQREQYLKTHPDYAYKLEMRLKGLKRCSRGEMCLHPSGPWLPGDSDHFVRDKTSSDGFVPQCKVCDSERLRIWRENNPDRVKEIARNHRQNNPDMVSARNKRYRERNLERIKPIQCEAVKRHYRKNRDVILKKASDYAKANRTTISQKERERRQQNPVPSRLRGHRRRARKRALPDAFTAQDWQRSLEYFNGCCAACGRPQGLWHTISPDHWIPLANPDCPGNVADNIVPLCNALPGGTDGCNNSKNNQDAVVWLVRKFGKRRAREILARIEAYFEWVRS